MKLMSRRGATPNTQPPVIADVVTMTLPSQGEPGVGSVEQRVDQVHLALGARWQSETKKDSRQWNLT
jgi:hypothetical protein